MKAQEADVQDEWMTKCLDSLQADRRELDKHGWQIPTAIYGITGVVLGVVLKHDVMSTGGTIPSAACFLLALLSLSAAFYLQRLHERKRYRTRYVRAIERECLRRRADPMKQPGFSIAPTSDEITANARAGPFMAKIFGTCSTTGLGLLLLVGLAAVLACGGFASCGMVVSKSVPLGLGTIAALGVFIRCLGGHMHPGIERLRAEGKR